jgi:hypothetical protein
MKLVTEWKLILVKAWSMKFWALSLLLGMFELAVPYLDGRVAAHTFTVLSLLAGIAGMVARLLQQLGLDEPEGQKDA